MLGPAWLAESKLWQQLVLALPARAPASGTISVAACYFRLETVAMRLKQGCAHLSCMQAGCKAGGRICYAGICAAASLFGKH